MFIILLWSDGNISSLVRSSYLSILPDNNADIFAASLLTLSEMGILWAGHRWGRAKKIPPENLSQISYNDETWQSYTSVKEDQKNI